MPLDTPVISSLANPLTTAEQRPQISWSAVDFASQYDVFIANIDAQQAPVVRVNTSSTSFTPTTDLGIGRFKVWIQAISGANVRSGWSLPLNLRINTSAVIGIGPGQYYADTAQPDFTWQGVAGAVSYDLWVNNQLTGDAQVIRTMVSGNSFTPAADLNAGVYRYWVRVVSVDGFYGGWSAGAEIYVGPTHVAPVRPTFETQPAFEWTGRGDVVSYDLWLQRGSVIAATPMGITATTWTPPSALPSGDYRWWVRPTLTSSVKGPWSAMQRFNVGGVPTISIPPVISASTNISWTPVTGAATYDLYIRRDLAGNAFITQVNQISANRNVLTSQPGTYRIWVRSISSTSVVSAWSLPISFVVAENSGSEGFTREGNVLASALKATTLTETDAQIVDKTAPAEVYSKESIVETGPSDHDDTPAAARELPDIAGLVAAANTPSLALRPTSAGVESHILDEDQIMADVHKLLMLLDA